ncbi:MAG: helix-turn-helix transcriptional regulator [Clostridiales bacterium]|nr:helix-turn-helix domain-containing protein [Roseburia sp.]MDD7636628.1 helix-turn-helix transcriptional regulator [Clostridiales bacterium]MDY4113738.1 helix-turn-helix transcriptional regulator [Roseburia sp.]
MNQEKVGKFIAECRKNKNLTQVQLAEQLGTTDKSVSKWENGICLPDSSLYEPLCNMLDISINELFAGQKIENGDYKRIADDNLLNLLKKNLYESSDKSVTFNEFSNALNRISETIILLNKFKTKDEAVNYLMKETKLSKKECSDAYDIYKKMSEK